MADKVINHDDETSLYVLYLEAITLHVPEEELLHPIDCVVHWYIGDTAHHQSINLRIDRQKVDIKYCVFVTVKNRKATEKDLNVCVSITGIDQAHLGVHFLSLKDLAQGEAFSEHTFDLSTQEGPYATIIVHGAKQMRWTEEIARHLERPQSDAVIEFVSPEEDSQSRHIWAFIAPEAAVGDSRGNRQWELPFHMNELTTPFFEYGHTHAEHQQDQVQHDTYGGTTGSASGMDNNIHFLVDPTTPPHDGYAGPAAYNYGAHATTTPSLSTILEQQQEPQQQEAHELEQRRQEEEKRRREQEAHELEQQGKQEEEQGQQDQEREREAQRGEEEEKERPQEAARRSSHDKKLFPRRSKNSLSSSSRKKILPRESRRSKSVSSDSIPDDFVAGTPREDDQSPSSRAHQKQKSHEEKGIGIHLDIDAYISTLQAGKTLTAVTAKNYRREIHVSISLDRRVLIVGLHPKDRQIAFTDIGPRVLRGREAEVIDDEKNSIHLTDECRTLCVDEDNITFEFPDMVHADTFGAALERLVLEARDARDALYAAQQKRLSSRNRASMSRASMATAAEQAERRRLSAKKERVEAESATSGTENTASPMVVHDPKPDHQGEQQHKGRKSSSRREGSKSSGGTTSGGKKNAPGSSKQRTSGTTSRSKSPRTPRRKRGGIRSSKQSRSSSTANLKELERIKEAARQEDLRRRHELRMRDLKRRERELDKREIEITRAKENATEEARQTMEIERAKTLALISHRLGTGGTGGGSPFVGGPTSSIPLDGDPIFNPQSTRIEEQAGTTHARGPPISRDRASGPPRTKDLSLNDVDASGLWMHHSEAQGAMRGSVSARMQALRGLAVSRDSERTLVTPTTNWDHLPPTNGGKSLKAQRGGHINSTSNKRGRSGDQRQQQQQEHEDEQEDDQRSPARSGDDETLQEERAPSPATSGDENRWEWDDEVREIRRTLSTDRRRASRDGFLVGGSRGSRKESKSSSQPPSAARSRKRSYIHEEYDEHAYGEQQALYERQQPLVNAIGGGRKNGSFVRNGGKTRNEKYREKENVSSNQDQEHEQPTIRELIVTQESSTPRFYGRNNNYRVREDLSATTHEYNKMRRDGTRDRTPDSHHHRAYHSYPFDQRNNVLERDYDESAASRSHDGHMIRHISAAASHRQSSVVGYRNESWNSASHGGRRNLDTTTQPLMDSESPWERESSVVAQRRPREKDTLSTRGGSGGDPLSSNGKNPLMSSRAQSEEKHHGSSIKPYLGHEKGHPVPSARGTPRGDLMSARSSNGTNLGGDSKVHFFRVLTNAIGVRESPHYDGRRTGDVLTRGTVCFVDAIHANHSDGRFYLHLADDQGWIFDDSRIDPSDPSVEIITGTGACIPPLYDHVLGYKPPVPVLSQVSRMLNHHDARMGTGGTGTHAPSSQYSQSYPSSLGHQPQHQPLVLPPPTVMSMIDSARLHRSPPMMNDLLHQHAAASTPNPTMTRSWETSPRTDLSVDLQALRSNYGIQPTITGGMSGLSLKSGNMSNKAALSGISSHLSHRTPRAFKPFHASPNPGLLSSPLTPPGTELLREALGHGSTKANKPREPKDTNYGFT